MRVWRAARLALHVLYGLWVVLGVYPWVSSATHQQRRQNWSRRLLAILGVELDLRGLAPQPGCLLVANHISWLDIFVINAVHPAAFVSKAEVRQWPLIGVLAARNETVFLRRGSRGHARLINAEIAALLDAAKVVAIFPEGTTTDGRSLLHFHAALLQPAIAAGHGVQALALSYHHADGTRNDAPVYVGDTTLGQSIAAIIAAPRTVARCEGFAPHPTTDADRRSLAQQTRAQIAHALGVSETGDNPATTQITR